MRPFADSLLTVKIAWYPAAPGARHLPHPSAFMSRDWVADPEECNTVGEVYDTPRYYNARKAIPTALGNHICGTEEQWAGRAQFNPAVNVTFNRDGLPSCCGVDEQPVGGLLVDPRASVGYTPSPYPGGLLVDPSAVVSYTPPTGPPVVLVEPSAVVSYSAPPVGGVEVEPSAVVSYTPPTGPPVVLISPTADYGYLPPSVPGATCETAATLVSGNARTATVGADAFHWWTIDLAAGAPFRFSTAGVTGSVVVNVWLGNCVGMSHLANWTDAGCGTVTPPFASTVKVSVYSEFGATYTVMAEPGSCP